MLFLLGGAVGAQEIPPKLPSHVVDLAEVIDSAYEQKLNGFLAELEHKTTANIVVLTVHTTGGKSMEEFSTHIASDQWRLGDSKENNGMLVLIAVKDRKYRIEVGMGLEATLPDQVCHAVGQRYFVPNFWAGNLNRGIYDGTLALAKKVAQHYSITIEGPKPTWIWQKVDPGKPTITKITKETTPSDFWLKKEDGLPPYAAIEAIVQLRSGEMVFATGKGMIVWDEGEIRTYTGCTYSSEQKKLMPGNSGLPGNSVQDLLVSKDGSLWIATNRGVCRIRQDKWEVRWEVLKVPEPDEITNFEQKLAVANLNDVWSLFETSEGKIILGSRRAGISVVDPTTGSVHIIYQNREMNNWVTGIAEDKEKNLWFGVFGLGVLRYDGNEFELYTDKAEWIPDKSIRSFCLDHEGNVWVGTHEGLGVRLLNGQSKVYTEADVLPNNFVDHFFLRKNGELWISTGDGPVIWDGRTWRYPTYRNWGGAWLRTCYEAFDGSFWIGGPGTIRNPSLKMKDDRPGE